MNCAIDRILENGDLRKKKGRLAAKKQARYLKKGRRREHCSHMPSADFECYCRRKCCVHAKEGRWR